MRTRTLSEQDAWRKIARILLTQGYVEWGLCRHVYGMLDEGTVTTTTGERMLNRLWRHTWDAEQSGKMLTLGKFHEERSLACLFLSLEAEDESRA